MRITILTNLDIHANIALNLLLPLFKQHSITLFVSDSVGAPRKGWQIPQPLQQLKLIEQTMFNQVLSPLIEQQTKDKRFLTFRELGELTGSGSIPLSHINTPQGQALFMASDPELVLSIRFGKIIKEPIISAPKHGVLNLHSGLLPHYQGVLTTLHALSEGQSNIGCTLHYIDSGDIDTGDIINTASFTADPSVSLFGHILKLYPLGAQMILDAVSKIGQGIPLVSQAQDKAKQRYYGLPEAMHFKALEKRGYALWHDNDIKDAYQRYMCAELIESIGVNPPIN